MPLDSIGFMIFFPIVVFMYFAIPKKRRYIWLLVASYYFYICWDAEYTFILLFSTLSTYLSACILKKRQKKWIFYICIILNLSILFVFKYGNFAFQNINRILSLLHMQIPENSFDIILPIGISFYILQALGYLIDVYRGKTEPEYNFIKYALYVSFFPTMLSGPIERSGNLLKQIQSGTDFSYADAKKGILLIVYGYFQKILIANRISILVDGAYSTYYEQTGAVLTFAIILYGIQIYVDFAGYSNIALGTAKMLGFNLIENFRQPYFATSIKEFWKRWHISLSSWLRDYVYISIGGSRCSTIIKYRNLMITFLVSAIWHGAGWKYIIWGGIHGIYQVIGDLTSNLRKKIQQKLRIKTECFSYHFFQVCITFFLVDFAWLFFSASSTSHAVWIIKQVVFDFSLGRTLSGKLYMLGMEEIRFVILLLEIIVVLIVDCLHERKISIISWLNKQNLIFRWCVYFIIVMVVLVGGVYNYGEDATTFIYTKF